MRLESPCQRAWVEKPLSGRPAFYFFTPFFMMTDERLFQLCKKYGAAALEARRKFAGLLPEVHRRRLYERKGYASIFEFAAKLSGMSEQQVRRVLNLEQKFQDKPALKRALVFGQVSVHKLARVASIATKENQEELAEKAKLLSQPALETLVRDEKISRENGRQNGFAEPKNSDESVRSHTNLQGFLTDVNAGGGPMNGALAANSMDAEIQQSLPDVNLLDHLSSELQKNLIERLKKGINIDQLLTELLQKHDLELAQEKEQLAEEICERERMRQEGNRRAAATHEARRSRAECASSGATEGSGAALHKAHSAPEGRSSAPTRYIPVRIRRLLRKEHGTRCSIRTCAKPAAHIHHTQRFALSHSHDPRYLAPRCREHHQIAHTVDTNYHIMRRKKN